MKTVALLYDHTLDVGGVESHLLGLLRNMPKDEYRFIIISQTSAGFAEKAKALGAQIIEYRRWGGLDPRAALGLAGILRREKVDLVHAHSPTAALAGRLAARWSGVPAVVTVHLPVTQYHGIRTTPRARLGRWIFTELDRLLNYSATNRLVYVSQRVRDECVRQRLSPAAISDVIPVGIPLERFRQPFDRQALRRELGAATEDVILTFAGRLDEQKGVNVLLEAAAIFMPRLTCARLWIVGQGPLRPPLEGQAHSLGLESAAHFWGKRDDVERILAASDLFVLPSRYEALPIALLEALAAGLPAVATQVGEVESVVQDGVNGFTVLPGDAAALAGAIERLAASAALRQRMGEKAREMAMRFDERVTFQQLEKIYAAALARLAK